MEVGRNDGWPDGIVVGIDEVGVPEGAEEGALEGGALEGGALGVCVGLGVGE